MRELSITRRVSPPRHRKLIWGHTKAECARPLPGEIGRRRTLAPVKLETHQKLSDTATCEVGFPDSLQRKTVQFMFGLSGGVFGQCLEKLPCDRKVVGSRPTESVIGRASKDSKLYI